MIVTTTERPNFSSDDAALTRERNMTMGQYDPTFVSDRQYADMLGQMLATARKGGFSLQEALDLGLLTSPVVAWEDDEFEYVYEAAA